MSKNLTTLKKAYCPKCKTDNELLPIFDVNPEADVCYCPNCMSELKPADVIDNYNLFISNKIDKANRLLFRDTKFLEAYEHFGDVLKIDSNAHRARFGRILSLIYMSTLRKSNFTKANLLLQEEANQYYHKLKDQPAYVKFLSKVDYALDEYSKRFYKKLVVKERFYNLECAELYFIRINEIITLKNTVLDELERSFNKVEDERTKHVIDQINSSLRELKVFLQKRALIVDGKRYAFEKINNHGQVVFNQLDETVNPLTHYQRHKLHEEERKGKLIKDKVYPDNSHITSLIKGIMPLFIIFLLLGVLAFAGTFLKQFAAYKLILYIVSGSCTSVGLICLILYIIWKVQLSKRHHLID